ncbi:PucR family transcriptional regulator [Mycobacterium branderi]|uniref:PucR family transcriptional regulator n=1 Tax=Mycobacterium branderi TaxID=43348 RepID=A0A7I7W3Q9_9MYCO|nr:helix-turn-helix domain-containing protein [Mycobacterium branderi]MCV7233673.1 helix-turn-helix domain-containing protein [Mycobacterium branderi]ORA37920.1 PucR family transcriptional regulator [Mycobacterium branderi]BBZ11073.1 PucR family transcriptional regulator [Mycobacterium branderi]
MMPDLAVSWDVLFDTLLGDRAVLAGRVREAIQAELSSYRAMPGETLDEEVGFQVERVLRSAHAGRAAVSDSELAELAAIGEARARQGIPVDDMLRAWRIGVEVAIGYARETAQRLGIDDTQVLEFVQSTLAWSDVAMVTTAKAHRKTELALAVSEETRGAAFVRGALFGTAPAAELRIQAEAYGLDPTREYVAVRAWLADGVPQRELERALGFHDPLQRPRGMCALVDGDVAGLLTEPPPASVEGVVGYGPPRPLDRLAESYRLAARALMTMQACGLRGAHDIASLGLRAAVAMDADVGDWLRQRYLEPLAAGGSACELMATLRAYLACGLHVERAATRLFVHQNTVRYRLARFEELTGASLRETQVLFEVWWALELSAMRL